MKICIENKDRHGLIYDIAKILLKYNINIISMEVIKNTTYLETEPLSYKNEQRLIAELNTLSGVNTIKNIMLMPHNEKYQQMTSFLIRLMKALLLPIVTAISFILIK